MKALRTGMAFGVLLAAEIPAFIWALMTALAVWLDPDIEHYFDLDDDDWTDYGL